MNNKCLFKNCYNNKQDKSYWCSPFHKKKCICGKEVKVIESERKVFDECEECRKNNNCYVEGCDKKICGKHPYLCFDHCDMLLI